MVTTHEPDGIATEHALLERRCDQVHTALAHDDEPLAPAEGVAKELCRQVFAHFRQEEEGYLQEVVRRAPWLADSARALQLQHRRLREVLAGIVARLDRQKLSPLERIALSADFDNFVVQFQQHEERENALLQEVFDRDVGNKD
jgi:hypothetical protein